MTSPRQQPSDSTGSTGAPRRRGPGARRTARVALVAGLAVAALTLSGCVTAFLPPKAAEPTTSSSSPATSDVDAELKPFYEQKLDWKTSGCADGFECATAKAPIDWDNPSDGELSLALVRHQATNGKPIGSLFMNPGGPGGSGYSLVADSLDFAVDKDLQENFDVVGFDPRGVGKSTPVTCLTDSEMDAYLYDVTPGKRGSDEWIAANEKAAKDFGDACAEETGKMLEFVDTQSAAKDLDMLRAAVGDKQLYYLGYSYGTFLGATYAELFPKNVGRLVLDGAIDPSTSNFEVVKEQAKGFESALRAYLEDCMTGKDCPFKGSVDSAMTEIKTLLDEVDANPIPGDDGRELGGNTLLTAIIYPLYQADAWPYLSKMFAEVMQGGTDIAFQFADGYNGRNESGKYADNQTEAFNAINCLDYSYDDDKTKMADEAKQLEEAAPVIGEYMAYGDTFCANWPYQTRTERGEIHAKGAAPILVVGTTNDPATPYVWAQNLAEQLDKGQLITYKGEGHTGYNKGSDCVNQAVDQYLIDGTVPSKDPMCS
ncbi:alpha/beta fold hydrolase [Plantibacter sp. VKM Ac-2885]|uniref:alpha/beta hydrolase n=1 Tax=unclassified Plantibacter TaxID=2624265 RepID=UPI00111098BB|nr:alpha/beta fold hydrolase [Plantibacter sp. VKM Ac-2885]